MSFSEILKVATTIIVAFGGTSAILIGAATWLGRVWAARILEQDRAKYAQEIEEFRKKADQELARLTTQLDIAKQTELRIHSDKIFIYRAAVDIVASILATLEKHREGTLLPQEGLAALDHFEKGRLQLYGYLGMLAPQSVMDAQDALMEYLLGAIHGEHKGEWNVVREHALRLLNEIRRDIGLDKTPIEYRGTR